MEQEKTGTVYSQKKIDHINLTVIDLKTASEFFKRYLGYKDMFESDNQDIAILENGSEIHINLMKGENSSYPKNFHIGFDFETEQEVDNFNQILKKSGIQTSRPTTVPWGSYTFSFKCPGANFLIEIACAKQ